jgi:sugar lactone lactonase YvrE
MSIELRIAMFAVAAALAGCESTCDPDAPGTMCTVAGLGTAGVSGDGEDATVAELYQPMDVTVGPDDRLYIADWNNHRIRAIDTNGVITTVAGTGTLGDGPPGPVLLADFNHPTNVEFDAQGDMWIAAWHNSRIRRVDLASGTLEDVAGTGARAYVGDGGPAAMAALDLPAAIQFDGTGNLIVVDQANQVIRRINLDGTIERIAGQCLVVMNGCGEGGVPVQCMGSDKWTCDPMQCMRPCEPGYAGDGGPAMSARFAMPFGQQADPAGRIALDAEGNIFLADTRNHRIRRIGTDGMVTTIAGDGTAGFAGDGGPATDAQLNNPVDVEFGGDGTLYIADTFNSCIRAIGTDGNIRTVAGTCTERGFRGDGEAPDLGRLHWPYGIDIDLDTNKLYIADTMNNRIRVVNL